MEKAFKVYKAENVENGWVYIGSTTSTVEERQKDHIQKSMLGSGHEFQDAINTYGFENFNWEQIDTASSFNELAKKETEYILAYDSRENGYNRDCGGGFKKIIYQYDIRSCKLVSEFNSLESAASAVNAHISSISAACLGKIKTCKGFYWSYDFRDIFEPNTDKRTRKVQQFNKQKQLIETFLSIAKASNSTEINKSCIAKCCRNERKSAGGFL